MRHVHQGTFKDQNGAVVGSSTTSDGNPGTVTVYLAGTSTLASVYAAETGGAAINSVSTDAYGYFYFWVDDGDYEYDQLFKITLTHPDFVPRSYDNIRIVYQKTDLFINMVKNADMLMVLDAGPVALKNTIEILCADEWAVTQNTTAAGTVESCDTGIVAIPKALKLKRNAASAETGAIVVQQALLTGDSLPLAGRAVEFSFFAKCGANFSATGSLINVAVLTGTGTDELVSNMGVWTGVATAIGTTQAITTTLTKYSFSGSIPSNATQIGYRIYFTPTGSAGADDSITATGFQFIPTTGITCFDVQAYHRQLIETRRIVPAAGWFSNFGASDPFSGCHLVPHNGNLQLINDKLEVIPSGSVASSGGVYADYSDCYVEGVANQSLTAKTLYYVYAWMNNGRMALNFSETAFIYDPRNGCPIKADDVTQSCIGLVYPQQTKTFVLTAGSAYGADGRYVRVAMTGGSGTGMVCDITVAGGEVTEVSIFDLGVGYEDEDEVSCAANDIGGTGTGFKITIDDCALTTFGGARGQTVASWFNRFEWVIVASVCGTTTATAEAPLSFGGTLANGQPEYNKIEWVQWFNRLGKSHYFVNGGHGVDGSLITFGIGIDGASLSGDTIRGVPAQGIVIGTSSPSINMAGMADAGEGSSYYWAQAIAYSDTGGTTTISSGKIICEVSTP